MPTDRRTVLRGVVAAGTTGFLGGFAGCLTDEVLGTPQGDTDTATPTPEATGTTEQMEETTTSGAAATVQVATVAPYGDVLVDAEGMSLYLFTQDGGGESACYGGCAQSWPPLTVDGEPTAGEGVGANLGTIERDDGSAQVTAAGNPLDYYAPDEEPGDANGQGVGGVWFLVAPDGSRVATGGTETPTDPGTETDTETDSGVDY